MFVPFLVAAGSAILMWEGSKAALGTLEGYRAVVRLKRDFEEALVENARRTPRA